MYAFAALQAVQEYQDIALEMLGQTEEVEAEARQAYKTEQSRRWFQRNPNGDDAIAAAAADTARDRVASYLLMTRLEQLRELAARPLDGDPATSVTTSPS
ncbi:hypothetical protein [Streptomyces virginiae]|uniref:hypothetical protein n=1 Tax=Streptomyces virginiae TaxID=1961 RepID=UPI003317F46E